jgi:hypothetical protein
MADKVSFEWNEEEMSKMRERYRKLRERLEQTEPTLLRAGAAVMRETRRRITTGGDGTWAPNMGYNALLRREGTLIRSFQIGGPKNITRVESNSIEVGSVLPYARMLQEGTGVYGPTGQPITPKNAKALAFEVDGKTVFAKSVEGTPARKMLYFDDELIRTVKNILKMSFFSEEVENTVFE